MSHRATGWDFHGEEGLKVAPPTTRPEEPPKPKNTEDRLAWYEYGAKMEEVFVFDMQALGHDIVINPDKEHDPMVPDLLYEGRLADLKLQDDTFWMSGRRYGIPPRWAFTFNQKDVRRYTNKYPDIEIFVWVRRVGGEEYGVKSDPLHGVFRKPFQEIRNDLITPETPIHTYQKRGNKGGQWNAPASFVLDLREFNELHNWETTQERGRDD